MEQLLVYIASAVSAAGLYILLARRGRSLRLAGGLIGLAGFAWLLAMVILEMGERDPGVAPPSALFYVFAFIILGAAGRMITHSRPVYSALYFVMVVLSSAAIFLLLEAEFMAFALVIVYAGAILITYLFVLMLAQQTPEQSSGSREGEAPSGPDAEDAAPEYDRIPREPAAGVAVGFLMLALLANVIFDRTSPLPPPAGSDVWRAEIAENLKYMPKKRQALVEAFREGAGSMMPPESEVAALGDDHVVFELPSGRLRTITFAEAGLSDDEVEALLTQNIERVGMALVHTFPVSLELAGVILLMAMFGAVVLARKQIELSEDEKREAAGLARLSEETNETTESGTPGGEHR